jgi:hypothetical protein
VFLTLGLYNVLCAADTESDRDAARAIAELCQNWEEWEIEQSRVVNVRSANLTSAEVPSDLLKGLDSSLVPTAREYATLIASSKARARVFAPGILPDDLSRFDRQLRSAVASPRLNDLSRQGLLTVANAALSRFSSQTFSGVSPILETESHYWTHSLLGVGVGSLALQQTRRFVENVFSEADIPRRLRRLAHVPPHPSPLTELGALHAFWESQPLFASPLEEVGTPDDPTLPLLTFFSARDGFRSTEISLSAPLETVSSCNTICWTLLTITHEMTHSLMGAILAQLLPRPDDQPSLERTLKLLDESATPSSLLDQIHEYCGYAFLKMSLPSSNEYNPTVEEFADLLRRGVGALNELLTHVFDFLYFYRGDAKLYIKAVWESWAVIPNIADRVADYLVRCLCALHSSNLKKQDSLRITYNQLLGQLDAVNRETAGKLTYLPEAHALLASQQDHFEAELGRRALFVKLARSLLFNSDVAQRLSEPSAYGSVSFEQVKAGEFPSERVSNPLRFIEDACKDRSGDFVRSALILTQLAFART